MPSVSLNKQPSVILTVEPSAFVRQQFESAGFCQTQPTITLGLAAGKVYGDEEWLKSFFEKKGWRFFGPSQVRAELRALRDCGYENTVAAIVAKLLLRGNAAT